MAEKALLLDGSAGEGGGQILRTSLTLSAVTGRAFRIENIRAGRAKPGLLRQHLTAVNATAEICGARVEGAEIGSRELSFKPGEVVAGEYRFAVGTAGSATLVFQTVLPPLLLAGGTSHLVLEGGTHNPHAPPFDFIDRCFLTLLRRMGAGVEATLVRPGFYPAGGGRFEATITPATRLQPIELLERGAPGVRRAKVMLANLPGSIAERELALLRGRLSWPEDAFVAETDCDSPGPGNAVLVEIGSEHVTEIVTAFGEKGVRAEAVIERVVKDARRYIAATAPVGEYLTDQLLLPFALAGGGAFASTGLSLHAKTNIEVIERFLPVRFETEPGGSGSCLVRVVPAESGT